MLWKLTVSSDGNGAHGDISQEDRDEQQSGPPVIKLGLLDFECLLEALFAVAIAILLISVLLLGRGSWRRRIVVLAVLGRLLSVWLALICALWLLGRRTARIVVRCFSLRHCDGSVIPLVSRV
jgi:hypothetical protein